MYGKFVYKALICVNILVLLTFSVVSVSEEDLIAAWGMDEGEGDKITPHAGWAASEEQAILRTHDAKWSSNTHPNLNKSNYTLEVQDSHRPENTLGNQKAPFVDTSILKFTDEENIGFDGFIYYGEETNDEMVLCTDDSGSYCRDGSGLSLSSWGQDNVGMQVPEKSWTRCEMNARDPNQWYHWTLSYDGESWEAYIDGEDAGCSIEDDIGESSIIGVADQINANIDLVRAWNRTLDEEDAIQLMEEGYLEKDKEFCNFRGPINECVMNETNQLQEQEYNISSIFESRNNAIFEAFQGPATLTLENTTTISGLWKGQINIEAEEPRIKSGASFRPEGERIVIGN